MELDFDCGEGDGLCHSKAESNSSFIIFGFVAELFFLGYLATKVQQAADAPSEERSFCPPRYRNGTCVLFRSCR